MNLAEPDTKKLLITGCDKHTEWMLPWFLGNYRKHNDLPIAFIDFGIKQKTRKWAERNFDLCLDIPRFKTQVTWFYKPLALMSAPAHKKCWIDTDCEVLGDISGVFEYTRPEKLGMVVDRPWTKRRKELWFNSGVVVCEGTPKILKEWNTKCQNKPKMGDQEVLHEMLQKDPLASQIYIEEVPNHYNWLRLQLQDGQDSKKKLVMHWTGQKGKNKIRELMKNGRKNKLDVSPDRKTSRVDGSPS